MKASRVERHVSRGKRQEGSLVENPERRWCTAAAAGTERDIIVTSTRGGWEKGGRRTERGTTFNNLDPRLFSCIVSV
jgi:hypothetical protein